MKRYAVHFCYQPPHNTTKPGFALVVALTLMAFSLLLLFSLTTLLRIETATSDMEQQRLLAREHAKLALHIALGELQKHAGPDQRVTARADILDDTPQTVVADNVRHPYWTGVWDTQQPDAAPIWLVSGKQPDPQSTSADILMVGAHSVGSDPQQHVYVDAITIDPATPSKFSHRCAYWIGDEGVKTSLLKHVHFADYQHEQNPNPLSNRILKRIQQITPIRPNNRLLFSTMQRAPAAGSAIQPPDSNYIQSRSQLNLLTAFNHADSQRKTTEANAHFHNVTPLALGVLSNTDAGGLQLDLSDPDLVDPDCPFPMNSEFRSFLSQRTDKDDKAHYRGIAGADTVQPGDPIHPIAPITHEIGLAFGLFREHKDSNRLKIEVYYRADVWNPLAVPMKLVPHSQPDLLVNITGVPPLTFSWELESNAESEKDPAHKPNTRDKTNNLLNHTSTAFVFDPYQHTIFNKDGGHPISLKHIPVDIGATMRAGKNDNASTKAVAWLPVETDLDDDHKNKSHTVTVSAPASNITIEIRTPTGELIQRFADLKYDAFTSDATLNATADDPKKEQWHCIFHMTFNGSIDRPEPRQWSDMEKWLALWDVRSLNWSLLDKSPHSAMISVSSEPEFAAIDAVIFPESPEFFSYKTVEKLAGPLAANYRFFDFPTTNPISVGYLTHLSFHQQRPYSIGNPWGKQKNQVFDRYFFSTLPRDGNSDFELQNHHLTPFNPPHLDRIPRITNGQHTAKFFLVRGAFNINSTSVAAWKAILSAIQLNQWAYKIHDDPIIRPAVQNGIFRLPFGADQTFLHPFEDYAHYPEITQEERKAFYKQRRTVPWSNSFSLGMRELRTGKNPEDPVNDVDDLARAVVEQLKKRQKPFNSMAEWVNSGVLQKAIDQTKINTVGALPYAEELDPENLFPRYSPSFLAQADIVNMLAPFAAARSDTFVIRAYGEAQNPIRPEATSQAWCEALVQRLPTPCTFRNNNHQILALEDYAMSPSPLGRTFKIVYFKWLSKNEI